MRDRIIYYGHLNNNMSDKLFNKALNSIKENKYNFFYLLPNGELLEEYRDRITEKTGGNLKVNLFTFDDIVDEILIEENCKVMNEEIKLLIIQNSLYELYEEEKLDKLGTTFNMPGFIKSLSVIIGNIKRSLISVDDFLLKVEDQKIYEEIGYLYERYQSKLKEYNLLDREELYFKAMEKLKTDSLSLKYIDDIIIDQFYDFRPIELKLLEELSLLDLNIYINIPFKFYKKFELIENNKEKLKNLGFNIIYIEEDRNVFQDIGYKYFSDFSEELDKKADITIFTAVTKELEIKRIFQDIKSNYKEGIQFKDMCITILDESYIDDIFKIAEYEKIPIMKKYSKSLLDYKLINEILLNIRIGFDSNFKSSILNILRSNFFELFNDYDMNELYMYLKSKNFNSLGELKLLINDSNEIRLREDIIYKLNNFLNILERDMFLLDNCKTIGDFNIYIKNRLENFKIKENIQKMILKDIELFKEYQKIYYILIEILDEIDLYSEIIKEINLEDYYNLLLKTIEEREIVLNRGNKEGVKVLDLIDNRGFSFKVNYIIGLSQELYPNIKDKNFIINEKNYYNLKKIGFEILNQDLKFENEIIKFASIIGSTKNKLRLSYNKGEDGSKMASSFIDELIRLVNKNIKLKEVSFDYLLKNEIKEITNYKDLEKLVLRDIFEDREINKKYIYDYVLDNLDKIKEINNKIILEYNRELNILDKYSGNISSDLISNKLLNENKDRIYSSSFLDIYAKCPYRFLLNNIFKVEDTYLEDLEYDPLVVGNIYHKTLRLFYENNRKNIIDEIRNKEFLDKDKYICYLKEEFNKVIKELRFEIEDNKSRLLIESLYEKLSNFLLKDLDRLEKYELEPYEFEKSFGVKKDFKISRDNEDIYILGYIDRLDKTKDDELIIIDYKSGSNNYKMKDILKGITLQLPIYLLANRESNPIMAIYSEINSGNFELGLSLTEKNLGVKGIRTNTISNEEDIESFFENTIDYIFEIKNNINKGNFSINPKECSDFCIYKNICRYEKSVEVSV